MNQDFLPQFRQQLATWIEEHLATKRLPFQRLELCPRILTEHGRFIPDLVLWINRDSQLAGSMILLPAVVNEEVLREASVTSKALGLGHFTTWAAREVSIWRVNEAGAEILRSFPLPPANQVKPEDFEWALENLLDELKVVTITTAPATAEYSLFYFANLCLRTLQDLGPGLAESARMSGGHTAADEWVELAPIEKSWLSLWRILFLLWQKRLPPGMQPDRLEQVFHYAMADFAGSNNLKGHIGLNPDETPLSEADAIRLHHLAGRMSQLGWPADTDAAMALTKLLLGENAFRYKLSPPLIPWETASATLWVNTKVPDDVSPKSIVAPRAYLAGIALFSIFSEDSSLVLAEDVQTLPANEKHDQTIALLTDKHIPDRKEKESRRLHLRTAWPNRRFDISHKSPAWILDTLYLAGITNEKLTVILPSGWHKSPGINVLWEVLRETYRLTDVSAKGEEYQTLFLSKTLEETTVTTVHRETFEFEIKPDLFRHSPGATQFWLKADHKVINYLQTQALGTGDMEWSDATRWGAFLYLHTQLGQYIWELCTETPELPRLDQIEDAILQYGIPIPDEIALQDLSLSGSQIDRQIPSQDALEREFSGIWGTSPDVPDRRVQTKQQNSKTQRKGKNVIARITEEVFIDGVPRFPEHYLMDTYKPELTTYNLGCPLEYAEEFFDTITLRSVDGSLSLDISGKILAEALILASWTGHEAIQLPTNPDVLERILIRYRKDLNHLWDKLTRECRRVEPQRQSALKMAKKLWQSKGLPPENLFQ